MELVPACPHLSGSDRDLFHQYKISLSYWSDGTRMIGVYTCSLVTNLVMLVSSLYYLIFKCRMNHREPNCNSSMILSFCWLFRWLHIVCLYRLFNETHLKSSDNFLISIWCVSCKIVILQQQTGYYQQKWSFQNYCCLPGRVAEL